jgi:AraC-like DNA-binding protein
MARVTSCYASGRRLLPDNRLARIPVAASRVIDTVHSLLRERPCHRPLSRDVALALALPPWTLRRAILALERTSIRQLTSQGCLLFAASHISAGTKIHAAMRLAGFRNRSSFTKGFRRAFGCYPSEYVREQPARSTTVVNGVALPSARPLTSGDSK